MPQCKVQPLKWEEMVQARGNEDPAPELTGWEADAGFYSYYTVELTGGGAMMRNPDYEETRFSDPGEARAAAQADYERRILSALDVSEAPSDCRQRDLTTGDDAQAALAAKDAEIERLRGILAGPEEPGSVYAAVERTLDERSAWVSRPDHETTRRVALAATIACNDLLGDPVSKVADAQERQEAAEIARDDAWERFSALKSEQDALMELMRKAHAVMRACGWHRAVEAEPSGDGVLEAACTEIEEAFSVALSLTEGE